MKRSTKLSSLQYTLLRRLPEEFSLEQAKKYNQTTFGSFGAESRQYVRRHGNIFRKTSTGREVTEQFGREDVFRRIITDRISVHFQELVAVKKTG